MPQLESPKRERVHVGAFVDPAQLEQVQELARRSDRSVSAIVRRALAEHVAAHSGAKAMR
jgi:predicted transcriptional regulator